MSRRQRYIDLEIEVKRNKGVLRGKGRGGRGLRREGRAGKLDAQRTMDTF